ncbi:STAS domain-containing protein [Oceanobacillus bengalensis]|uniref:Anti-sigma factor antagonist n=1 Tax=Oceanobacillus bengalensis TaxID=1435466 RepID=A0A494YRV3_9BACI|nr:STAS domain-containing protein [Oceanobacillus bengalensis]RKQ12359.1 anti-sigma factor antagonist [Oceanobacillus bengalensis]
MNLTVNVEQNKARAFVKLTGEIDVYTAPNLKEKLLPLTKIQNQVIEVDFSGVSYMDSTGLGVFVSALKSTKENSSSMRLVHLDERIYRVFRITGLIEIMDVHRAIKGGEE